jgi:hypothetical protein
MLAQWEVCMTWRGSMITSVGGEVAPKKKKGGDDAN